MFPASLIDPPSCAFTAARRLEETESHVSAAALNGDLLVWPLLFIVLFVATDAMGGVTDCPVKDTTSGKQEKLTSVLKSRKDANGRRRPKRVGGR